MTVSTFSGLQTSLRGLLAQQRLLDVTSHNIANASTAGYTRQRAVLEASPAQPVVTGSGTTGWLGTGVDVTSFARVRDSFTDLQYRAQNSNLGSWNAQSQALDQAQDALNEPSDTGLQSRLSAFWGSWSDFANAPTDPAAKQAVIQQGQSLADAFASVRGQIATVQQQAYAQYQDLVRPASGSDPGGEIAQTATQLAQLNDIIRRAEVGGEAPNDLLDQRDQLLDKLSGYGQITVTDNGDGTLDVAFGSTGIVSGTASVWNGAPSSWAPGGELGGLLAVADPATGSLQDDLGTLDTIAGNLATLVNGAYGGTFFQTGTPAAGTLAVAPGLVQDPTTLSASSTAAGANDAAQAVAALQGNASVDGAYRAFVTKVGSAVRNADGEAATAQALTDTVANRRESVSAVSTDEEMTNLIEFQRGYQASARAMTTLDDILDQLINRTGKVGL